MATTDDIHPATRVYVRMARDNWQGPRRGMLQRFGEPDWRRISRAEVEQLIGQDLGEPACTCQVARADT